MLGGIFEKFRWVITVGFAAGAFYAGGEWGMKTERAAWLERDNTTLRQQVNELEGEVGKEADRAEGLVADMAKIQESMNAIARRTNTNAAQLVESLKSANLGVCILDDTTRRVRGDSYAEAGRATALAAEAHRRAH